MSTRCRIEYHDMLAYVVDEEVEITDGTSLVMLTGAETRALREWLNSLSLEDLKKTLP